LSKVNLDKKKKKKKDSMNTLKEHTLDIAKSIIIFIVFTGLAFLYWMVVLLIMSLILLNVWHVSFDSIVQYSVILTVVTALGYIGWKIHSMGK